ncbi:uncharacterized protein LOC126814709 isoform X1 [Patella vulgata]|uniref:uncharacterized protein LOC126814709 isoform X1 n=1 Tax=Patella vulgata TaxID=6465 RepID=UPI00217F7F00|nr:uncharacterized protein LOC126814709 isoform X1 [Patella vulgata]XP_050396023.1 uncharacterized protein LOC126814709 isoform X1 [Patella vulgata]XP_050396024.1 uncharacterized protein LOC126814709 isoform X1 [Patella vulgata]
MVGVIPKPKLRGKKYHYCVLYNYYEGPASNRNKDHQLSRAFLAKMEDELAACGFTDSYYFEKILPGSNLFEVFTAGLIEPSEKVVVILTEGFRVNYWHKYTEQTSFKNLIDGGKSTTFLPIVIGEGKDDIPEKFGLIIEQILYFEKEWEVDEVNWARLRNFFLENKSVSALYQRSESTIPVEETHDADTLAEDGAPDINNLSVSSGIEILPTPAMGQGVSNTSKPGVSSGIEDQGQADRPPCGSASISRPGGVARGVSDGLPTIQVISNLAGPRGDTADAAMSFPDLPLTSPDSIEEDRPHQRLLYYTKIHRLKRISGNVLDMKKGSDLSQI